MEDSIRKALDSEYNNVGDLAGMDDALMGEVTELMGTLGLVEKIKLMRKLGGRSGGSRGSRAEFEKFFKEVPKEVQKQLLNGDLRLADYTVYSLKQVKSKTVKLFETQDIKETGITNISQAKLSKNSIFLVSGIYLLAGVAADDTNKDIIKSTALGSVNQFPAIANAEFYLKANKKQIIPEGANVRKFITDNNHLVNMGYVKLDNPRIIKDDELIEFVVELGTMQNLDAKTFLFVGLDGTITTP
ncbi:MAG: hypothetical protein ACXVNO_01450 [Bacteroidia bacterium]